jgi:hypothetical protein
MADIEISGSTLVVHIGGIDQLLALKSRIEVPLAHIAEVSGNPPEAHRAYHGLRMGGTNLPGVITAGRFLEHGEWAFWDVHDPDKAILIRLHDEGYAKLVVGVDDPAAAVSTITSALGR